MCGVSSLGIDHTSILGDTIEKIAWQKGGIFKVMVLYPSTRPACAGDLEERNELDQNCGLSQGPVLAIWGSCEHHSTFNTDLGYLNSGLFYFRLQGKVKESYIEYIAKCLMPPPYLYCLTPPPYPGCSRLVD